MLAVTRETATMALSEGTRIVLLLVYNLFNLYTNGTVKKNNAVVLWVDTCRTGSTRHANCT